MSEILSENRQVNCPFIIHSFIPFIMLYMNEVCCCVLMWLRLCYLSHYYTDVMLYTQDILGVGLEAPLTLCKVIYTLPMSTVKEDKGQPDWCCWCCYGFSCCSLKAWFIQE